MARRRAVTVTCHCALPRPCQGGAIVQRTPRQAHPVVGSDAGPDRARPPHPTPRLGIDRSMDGSGTATNRLRRALPVRDMAWHRPAGLARASPVPRPSLTRTSVSQRRRRPRVPAPLVRAGHRGLLRKGKRAGGTNAGGRRATSQRKAGMCRHARRRVIEQKPRAN